MSALPPLEDGAASGISEAAGRLESRWDELEALYRTAPIGLAVLDTNLRFQRINDWLAEINGAPASEHIGRSVSEMVPDLQHQALKALRTILSTGQALRDFEFTGETPARPGVIGTWREHWHPIRNKDGEIVGVSLVVEDYTERKRMEAALKDANRRKDEFLAILGHELRNPMGAITNALNVLEKSPRLNEADKKLTAVMFRQLTQMRRLLNDLVDVSRSDGKAMGAIFRPAAIADVINDAVNTVETSFRERGQRLTVHLTEERLDLRCDKDRLVQMVCNLLSNASKYSPRGSRVWVSAVREGNELVLRVQDEGVGIAAESLQRVFDIYERGNAASELAPDGLGIGLALVQRIAELHDGVAYAESSGLNQGSTFTVRIPLAPPGPTNDVSLQGALFESSASTDRLVDGKARLDE